MLLSRTQQGWVSLPIIALLLTVSALSVRSQETLLAGYRWRGQLNDVETAQEIWSAFHAAFVTSPNFSSAIHSDCVGFCDLSRKQSYPPETVWKNTVQGSDDSLNYQWVRSHYLEEEASKTETFVYRLCATQNQQDYHCWWWREDKLISNGWVSTIDS